MSNPIPPQADPIDELTNVLRMLNNEKRNGRSEAELDAWTQENAGMSFKEFARKVGGKRRDPDAPAQIRTKDLLRMEAYGATLGWLDEIQGVVGALRGTGYVKARDAARAEIARFEKEHPRLALLAKSYGAGATALAGATGVLGAAGGAGIKNAMAVPVSAGAAAGLVGGIGAGAGAGGMLGEQEGMGRVGPAMMGGAATLGGGAIGPLLRGGGAAVRGGLGLAQRGAAATKGASPVTKGVLAYEGIDKGSKLLKMLMGKASPGGLLDMLE